ncbi:MAG TPA: hypothetical protein VHM48_08905, partial [Candidatus Limnocylindrales bacterium]|nr:hypothetical protein [Candidatus Limnocylindrales bacterium]
MRKSTSGSSSVTVLRQIETTSPFRGLGRLPDEWRSELLALGDEDLGRAITILLHHAAALPSAAAAGASEAIDELVGGGPIDRLRPGLDPADLVAVFAAISRDASRQDLTRVVVRLLQLFDPDDVLAVVGVDARSLDLRARLSGEFAQAAMAPPPDDKPHSRGIDFDQFG